jgi:hypothetical protein
MPPVGEITVTPFPRAYTCLSRGKRKRASISPLLLPGAQRLHSEARLGFWALSPPSPGVLQDLHDYGTRSAEEWMRNRGQTS